MNTATKMPAWEVILNTHYAKLNRPRFFSLHTLATLTRRKDLKRLAKELKDSGRVAVCYCPIVRAIVFFPAALGGRYGNYVEQWNAIDKFLVKHPYPAVRGFKAPKFYWTGGSYGKGEHVIENNGMSEPFIKEDYAYANLIIDNLRKAGYTPGIKKYPI